MANLSVDRAVHTAWDAFSKNWPVFVGATVLTFIVTGIVEQFGLPTEMQSAGTPGEWAAEIAGFAVNMGIQIGFLQMALSALRGGKVSIGQLVPKSAKTFFKALGATILYTIVIVLGFAALTVPGIYLSMRYGQYMNLIVDKDMGILESFKASAELTKGKKLQLFGYGILLGLLAVIGLVILLVGILATLPLALIAMAEVYRQLVGEGQEIVEAELVPAA